MLDKRVLANEQLEDVIDPGVVSLAPTSYDSEIKLPDNAIDGVESMPSVVHNSFNINVNAPERVEKETIQTKVNTVIKNALPTLTGSAESIKKNSVQIYQNILSPIFNQYTRASKSATLNPIYDVDSPAEKIEDAQKLFNNYKDRQSIPELLMRSIAMDGTSPSNGNYTLQQTQQNNNLQNLNKYQSIIQNNSSYNISDNNKNINLYTNNNQTQLNENISYGGDTLMSSIIMKPENNIDYVTNVTRERALNQMSGRYEDSISRQSRNSSLLQQLENEDLIEATTTGSTQRELIDFEENIPSVDREDKLAHFTETNDIPYFQIQANNPPVWRVVS